MNKRIQRRVIQKHTKKRRAIVKALMKIIPARLAVTVGTLEALVMSIGDCKKVQSCARVMNDMGKIKRREMNPKYRQ